jgi:hypothetical protein
MRRRKTAALPAAALRELLAEVVKELSNEVAYAQQLRGILEMMDASVFRTFDKTGGLPVLFYIRAALARDLALIISRCLDPTTKDDVLSLQRAMHLVGRPDVQNSFDLASRVRLGAAHGVDLPSLLKSIRWHWSRLNAARRTIDALNANRNAYLAHNLRSRPTEHMQMRQAYRLIKQIVPIVSGLCRLVGEKGLPFERIYAIAKHDSRYFWRAVAGVTPPPFRRLKVPAPARIRKAGA